MDSFEDAKNKERLVGADAYLHDQSRVDIKYLEMETVVLRPSCVDPGALILKPLMRCGCAVLGARAAAAFSLSASSTMPSAASKRRDSIAEECRSVSLPIGGSHGSGE